MKIFLVGEYSGLHHNLAMGLMDLGHNVTVASNGDGWKNYTRDIDFQWNLKYRKLSIIAKLAANLHKLRGYDVVQLINPIFLELKAERNLQLFRYLKRNNNAVFLGANGDDYVYINQALNIGFASSVFNIEKIRSLDIIQNHINTNLSLAHRKLNETLANQANGITACCTEYQIAYSQNYSEKLCFVPLPIICSDYPFINTVTETGKVKFFLGIQEKRQVIKGMDVIYEALCDLQEKYPNDVDLQIAKNVPFAQYQTMMDSSHVLCDQLYSYGCGVNGAMAMAKGLVVAGGGEEEMYRVFGENDIKPLINLPDAKSEVIKTFESLLERRKELPILAQQSREFALKHHDHIKVAQRYLDFWMSKINA